jgi:hypothetical protein
MWPIVPSLTGNRRVTFMPSALVPPDDPRLVCLGVQLARLDPGHNPVTSVELSGERGKMSSDGSRAIRRLVSASVARFGSVGLLGFCVCVRLAASDEAPGQRGGLGESEAAQGPAVHVALNGVLAAAVVPRRLYLLPVGGGRHRVRPVAAAQAARQVSQEGLVGAGLSVTVLSPGSSRGPGLRCPAQGGLAGAAAARDDRCDRLQRRLAMARFLEGM